MNIHAGIHELSISTSTWDILVKENSVAVRNGWAAPGVFGTGIGPSYHHGGILWVGKSAGPLGSLVGSNHSQAESSAASAAWMVQRQNRRSAFWQMAEQLDPTRRLLAWTNIAKMDRIGSGVPPKTNEWATIASACTSALIEEIEFLKPGLIVFATSGIYSDAVSRLVSHFGFKNRPIEFEDGWTRLYGSDRSYLITTKHPQGWSTNARNRVVNLAKQLQRVTAIRSN